MKDTPAQKRARRAQARGLSAAAILAKEAMPNTVNLTKLAALTEDKYAIARRRWIESADVANESSDVEKLSQDLSSQHRHKD
ncbi:MAG: hypothetical protein M1817_005986 [Caeruleum heppii]|nr:MAG: hypothetical protein M1817_005986 [Caeruleum heppii]